MRKKKDKQNQISEREAQYSNFLFSALFHLWVYKISIIFYVINLLGET